MFPDYFFYRDILFRIWLRATSGIPRYDAIILRGVLCSNFKFSFNSFKYLFSGFNRNKDSNRLDIFTKPLINNSFPISLREGIRS